MKLGDIITLQRGTTYKSSLLGLPGPVLLGLASIKPNGGFRDDSLKTYGGVSPEKLILEPGDLYVSLKDVTQSGDLLGAVSRVPETISKGRLTQDTVKLIFIKDIPKDFIYWLLRTPIYRDYCRMRATGTTNLGLSRDDFFDFPIPEPTNYELEIAKTLEDIEKKIELNRRMNRTLESMARAVFRQWFVDNEDSKNWDEQTLDQHVEAERGLSYKGEGLSKDNGTPMHNLNSVYEGGAYKYEGIKYYTGEYKDRHVLKAGDLIVTNTEQGFEYLLIGYPAIVPKHFGPTGIFSHHIYRVRPLPTSPIKTHYLYFLLMHPTVREQVIGCTNGTTVNMLSVDGLRTPKFKLPPLAMIDKFEGFAIPIFEQMELLYEESRTLASLRDSLLPKLMRGEVRVKV